MAIKEAGAVTIGYNQGKVATAALTATGAQAITVADQYLFIDGATTQATGNRTIDLTIADGILAGARIFVKSKTNGTETTIFGTGIDSATITGVAGKTFCQEFVYDGTSYKPAGASVQID